MAVSNRSLSTLCSKVKHFYRAGKRGTRYFHVRRRTKRQTKKKRMDKGPKEIVEREKVDKVETVEDVVVKDVVVKDSVVSVDTTDKRTQYSSRQNTFAAKKTVAQGMMDVALITANANQLRYLLEYQRDSPTFYLILILIIISLMLQVAVGVSLIFKGRFDMRGQSKSTNAERINNYVVVAVFLITIINVFIAAFSVTTPSTSVPVSLATGS